MCLPESDHQWPRFVIPSGTLPLLDGDFLYDPAPEQGRLASISAINFESLSENRCVILVGDSGMGKSNVLRRTYQSIHSANEPKNRAIFCPVRDYSSDAVIEQFFTSLQFEDWRLSDANLTLIIDGLDEGVLRGDKWDSILKRRLDYWSAEVEGPEGAIAAPIQRLRLRVSCRPGVWPESLIWTLKSYFSRGTGRREASSLKWDLLPLRQVDVERAAVEHALDPANFLREVKRTGATAFASRPLTLKLLLRTVEQERKLPKTQIEMFRKGCEHLVQEHNLGYRESMTLPKVNSERKLQVAGRIAGLSVFCGKPWIERTTSPEPPSDDLTLKSGEIRRSAIREDITELELHATLDSALFSFDNSTSFRWAHQAFASFLAADWCARSKLSDKDLLDLILIHGLGGFGVPQQVSLTAAWLSEMRPKIQSILAERSPSALFNLDETAVDDRLKPLIVRRILSTKLSFNQNHALMQFGSRLNHPALVRQLEPSLAQKSSMDRKYRAIDLAIACKLAVLSDDLARIALDPTEQTMVRRHAAFAIAQFGTDQARRELLPLTSIDADSKDQDLRGWALDANWPMNLSCVEVLRRLVPRRDPNYFGGYENFVIDFSRRLGSELTDQDVFAALEWCSLQRVEHNLSILNDVVAAIIIRAFESAENRTICAALVGELIGRMRARVNPLPRGAGSALTEKWVNLLVSKPRQRASLIVRALADIAPADYYMMGELARLVGLGEQDIPLLAGLARTEPLVYSKPVGVLLRWMGRSPAVLDQIYEGISQGYLEPELSSVFVVNLDDPIVQSERDLFLEQKRNEAEWRDRQADLADALEASLNASDAGNPQSWVASWNALWSMDGGHWGGSPKIEDSPGWSALDETQKQRLLQSAIRFALASGDLHFDFIGENQHPLWVVALYSALLFAWRESPNSLSIDEDGTWRAWTITTLWFPYGQNQEDWERLLEFLYGRSANGFISAAEFVINEQLRIGSGVRIYQTEHFKWPQQICEVLLRVVDAAATRVEDWSACVEWGLRSFPDRFGPRILDEIESLRSVFPMWEPDRRKLATACMMVFRYGQGDPWEQISQVFYERPSISKDVFPLIGQPPTEHTFLERMSDVSLGELYVWLVRHFVEQPDDAYSGFGPIGSEFNVRMLRDATFGAIRDRGNLRVFDFVARTFPEKKWIEFHRPTAVEASLRRQWKATTPESLLDLMDQRSIPYYQTKSAYNLTVWIAVVSFFASLVLPPFITDIKPLSPHHIFLIVLVLFLGLGIWGVMHFSQMMKSKAA